ncbi:hypothetical protein [Clostridium sardiniense]
MNKKIKDLIRTKADIYKLKNQVNCNNTCVVNITTLTKELTTVGSFLIQK